MSNEQFSLAQRLAALASELEEMPDSPCIFRHMTADFMHAMARKLAGDRSGEIYDMTEDGA